MVCYYNKLQCQNINFDSLFTVHTILTNLILPNYCWLSIQTKLSVERWKAFSVPSFKVVLCSDPPETEK